MMIMISMYHNIVSCSLYHYVQSVLCRMFYRLLLALTENCKSLLDLGSAR